MIGGKSVQKPRIAEEITGGQKIGKQDSTRRDLACIFGLSEMAETIGLNKTTTISSAAVPPPQRPTPR
jgi:hypothetical protein